MEAKNVDDILVKDMQNQQAPVQPIPSAPVETPPPPPPQSEAEPAPEPTPRTPGPQDQGVQPPEDSDVPRGTNEADTKSAQQDSVPNLEQKMPNIDEYGNPIEKPRVYTEDEVQHIINDRMAKSRIALKQQEMQQQTQNISKDFKADPDSEESWEVQLNNFIDKRLESRQAELQQKEYQRHVAQKQAEFEAKFNSGMSKYHDFEQVVSRAAPSITPSMMFATSGLDNPAAFLYAAAKLHPGELERISKIDNNLVQAAEVGRLHERMVKQRGVVSGAPKPIESPKSDIPNKPINPQPSIDQRINDYGRQKQQRR